MTTLSDRLKQWQIGLVACVSGLLQPHTLRSGGIPDDSALYAYIGWAMAHGKVPYVTVWDHKGPLLYLLQWFGAVLSNVPGRGVSLLDLLASIVSAWFLLSVVNRIVTRRAALVLMVGSLFFCTFFCSGGNMTETWAVPLLAMAHLVAWRTAEGERGWTLGAVAGAAAAAIFWLRPNMVVFAGLAAGYVVWRCLRTSGAGVAVEQAAGVVVSALAVTGAVLLPYWRMGALGAMRAAYFGYNVAYSKGVTTHARVAALHTLLSALIAVGLAAAGLVGWMLTAASVGNGRRYPLAVPVDYRIMLLMSAVLEFTAAAMSGRAYPHYLYVLGPTILVLAALGVRACGEMPLLSGDAMGVLTYRRLVWLLVLVVGLGETDRYLTQVRLKAYGDTPAVTRFVSRTTDPGDKVALLGGPLAADVYLRSRRMPTSEYFYTLPLLHRAFPGAAAARADYVAALDADPPKVIASAPPQSTGSLCATTAECAELNQPTESDRMEGYTPGALENLLQPLLAAKYVRVNDPAFGRWRVYVKQGLTNTE